MCRIGYALLFALAAELCHAQTLLLAPGRTLVILDAADPRVRVVLSAPADAPLDLGAILVTGPDDTVYSIVTRIQTRSAGALARQADGSLVLSEAASATRGPATVLQGGVLVFSDGKFVYHPIEPPPARSAGPPAAGAPSQGRRLLISRPGVDKAQAERDIAHCRRIAEDAAAQFLRSADKVEMYNGAMYACLKGFGYRIHAPAT